MPASTPRSWSRFGIVTVVSLMGFLLTAALALAAPPIGIRSGTSSEPRAKACGAPSVACLLVPPVANDDAYTGTEDIALTADAASGVLANDTDAENDVFSATLLTLPASGSLTLEPNGAFTYTPAANANGVYTFTYAAVEGSGYALGQWTFNDGANPTLDSQSLYPGALLSGTVFTTNVPISLGTGLALQFDGVNDSVIVTGPVTLANQSFSVAFWAQRTSLSGNNDFIVGQGTGVANNTLHMGFRSNNTFTCAFWNNDLNTLAAYTDTDWHHWACTYDAATNVRRLYRDGTLVASDIATADYQGSGPLAFGTRGGEYFTGLLDDVRVYYSVLSAAEVQAAQQGATPTVVADSATVTMTLAAVPDTPTAVGDNYILIQDTANHNLPVLANDSDADGDSFTFSAVGTPNHGGTVIQGSTSLTYTPAPNFFGTETFTYTIVDSTDRSDTALVTITVASNVPVAVDSPGRLFGFSPFQNLIFEHNPATYALISDARSLTMPGFTVDGVNSVVVSPITGQIYAIVKVSSGSRRLVTLDPVAGIATDIGSLGDNFANLAFATNGTLYGVTGDGATVRETLYRIDPNTAATTLVRALGNGADGEIIAFNPQDGRLYHASGNSTVVWESIDLNTLTITPIPIIGSPGGEFFHLQYIGDGVFAGVNISNQLFKIDSSGHYTNMGIGFPDDFRGLVFAGTGAYTLTEDSGLNVNILPILANDYDANGDVLTATLDTPPAHAAGFSLTAVGMFAYTPTANYCGPDSFTYHINDGLHNSNTATVSLAVACTQDPPVAAADAYTVAQNSTANSLSVLTNDSDIDGDSLTIVAVGAPDQGGTLTNEGTTLAYTPTTDFLGVEVFTYTLTDGYTNTATATVTLTVIPSYLITPTAGANGAITPSTPQAVTQGDSITFTIAADTGYHIADVGVDGVSQGAISSYTFNNVTASHTITAAFAINTYTLTVATAGAGSGVVTPTVGVYTYTYGTIITPTATANPGSAFAGWSGACSGTGACVVTMTSAQSVTATFDVAEYKLYLPLIRR